ncbi:MAG: hypothetical protein AB7E85_03390 [Pseudobdellovibrionaceae bacterium]
MNKTTLTAIAAAVIVAIAAIGYFSSEDASSLNSVTPAAGEVSAETTTEATPAAEAAMEAATAADTAAEAAGEAQDAAKQASDSAEQAADTAPATGEEVHADHASEEHAE